ncbi:MAG: hypothetical protein WB767_03385 [Nocardioides sp.]
MSSSLGNQAPPAVRASGPGWRDPRLWVGVAIVAGSVLLGVRVLDAADDTVPVWAVNRSVAAGEQLSDADLVARRVHFADDADLARYLTVDQSLPAELEVARPLSDGELLPRSALDEVDSDDTVHVALPVAPLRLPPTVGTGTIVDVYLSGVGGAHRARSGAVLSEVPVVDVPGMDDAFATGGDRQIVLGVDAVDVADLYEALAAYDSPVVSIAVHP